MANPGSAHSCDFCNSIILSPGTKEKRTSRLFLNRTLRDIQGTSASACDFAQYLLGAFGDGLRRFEPQHTTTDPDHLILFAEVISFASSPADIHEVFRLGISNISSPEHREICSTRDGRDLHRLVIYTTEDDPAGEFISSRPINTNPGSPTTFNLIKTWLRDCTKVATYHPRCNPLVQTFMPTRLLKVDKSEDSVSLCCLSEMNPYATLSYCWGGDQPHKLTVARCKEYMRTIDVAKLPASIRDAIKVTARLGLEYLWIDSLCIIQDDPKDVAREIALMSKVYSQAIVTICASKAEGASEGFLNEVDVSQMASRAFRLPYQCPNGKLGSVYLTRPNDDILIPPLSLRGWAFQERCLSARVLDYGPCQVRCVCNSSEEQTILSDGWQRKEFGNLAVFDVLKDLERILSHGKSIIDEDVRKQILASWRNTVKAYTNRELTVPADRILAVSALAERYGDVLQDEYFAGLWRCSLPMDLLWYNGEFLDLGRGTSVPRPNLYQGPSWSWTGVTGSVEFYEDLSDYSFAVNIIDVRVHLSEPSATYGAVKSGILRVRGRLANARWDGHRCLKCEDGSLLDDYVYPDALETEFVEDFRDDSSQSSSSMLSAGDDGDAESLTSRCKGSTDDGIITDVALLQICYLGVPANTLRSFGLILRIHNNELVTTHTRYSRLGVFQFFKQDAETMESWPKELRARSEKQAHYFDNCGYRVIEIE